MYKHICFWTQLTLILAVSFVIFLGSIFSWFQLFLLKNIGNGQYVYPSDSFEHSYNGMHDRTSTTSSIALAHVHAVVRSTGLPCDYIALSYNTRFYCTTVEYSCKIYCKIQCVYIAQQSLWIVRVLYKYFFIWYYFGNSFWAISTFLVAWIFCPFCLCNNSERGFKITMSMIQFPMISIENYIIVQWPSWVLFCVRTL